MSASPHHIEQPHDRPRRRDIDSLTRRERQVLALIAAGSSNQGIREALVLSPKTVESHVHNIFQKLDVPRSAALHARVLAARMWIGRNQDAA